MIDFHTHIYPPELASRALNATFLRFPLKTDATLDGQLRLMDAYGVAGCAALCIANRPDQQAHVNRFARTIDGERVFAFGSVHPHAPDALEELEMLYSAGIRGIKFQPVRQRFSLEDAACKPLFQKIGALHMITVIHCGTDSRGAGWDVLPQAVERCIPLFGGSPVICAHMGGMLIPEKELDRLYPLPVYVDTALSAHHLGQHQFDRIAQRFGPDRILFGTDLPWAYLPRERMYVDHSPFSDAEKALILDGNARRLLAQVGRTFPEAI